MHDNYVMKLFAMVSKVHYALTVSSYISGVFVFRKTVVDCLNCFK